MARFLTPDDYGLVGMVTVFIAIAQSLIDCGFSQALIQKQNRTNIDNTTVFYFNIVIGFIIYLLFFFSAPLIALFYKENVLTAITRIISLSIVANSFVIVQRALLTASLNFKIQAKASFIAAIIGGLVGIALTYYDFGVWAIVWYQLINTIVNVLFLWRFCDWRPLSITYFSKSSFNSLFRFGSKLAGSGIIDTVYNNLYILLIGKIYNSVDLGYYTRASQFAQFPSVNFTGIIQRVTLPVLCSIQDDEERIRDVFLKFIKCSAFIVFPLMIGLSVLAKSLILVLLNDQWSYTSRLLSIICYSLVLYPIHAINLNVILAKGFSKEILKLEIIKKITGIIILLVTVPFGLEIMCYGLVASSLICLIYNSNSTGKIIGIGFLKQFKVLMPAILKSTIMGIFIWLISLMIEDNIIKLILGSLVGISIYFSLSIIMKSDEWKDLKSFIKK